MHTPDERWTTRTRALRAAPGVLVVLTAPWRGSCCHVGVRGMCVAAWFDMDGKVTPALDWWLN